MWFIQYIEIQLHSDSFTFKVNDGTVDSDAATVTINITAVNDKPVATAQTVTATEQTAKSNHFGWY